MLKQDFGFKIIKSDKKTRARVGEITTAHGIIKTPAFVPVGTKATVKGLTPQDLKEAEVQILFGNTYHLHLRPGENLIKDFGGLGRFMSWDGPTITDSGGFQVFSLGQLSLSSRTSFGISKNGEEMLKSIRQAQDPEFIEGQVQHDNNKEEVEIKLVNITENGVMFRSHIDGSQHLFTPEISIEIQKKLGADIILAFDECAPHPSNHEYAKEAMERTHKWAIRSIEEFQKHSTSEESLRNTSEVTKGLLRGGFKQALYGIIQGGVYKDLREESAKFISNLGFDGIAIGGVSVGESKEEMRQAIDWSYPFLPENKPRHLLGIGEIDDVFDVIERGMDTFDCVIPTRFGRYGIVFVDPPVGNLKNKFRIDLNKVVFAKDKSPLSKDCSCYVCKTFTRAYIHHLFRAQELLAYRLASYHNMFFINNLVKKIREAILEDEFQDLKNEWLG